MLYDTTTTTPEPHQDIAIPEDDIYAQRRAKWIAALRSGKYGQTFKSLRGGPGRNTYCCLGVACEVSGLGTWEWSDKAGAMEYVCGKDGRSTFPPAAVQDYYGIAEHEDLFVDGAGGFSSASNLLTRFNDLENCSFDEIANRLESIEQCIQERQGEA